MNKPDMGRRNMAMPTPPIALTIKQTNIARLNTVTTAAQFNLASIHEPINLSAARSTRKIEIA
jgi:hypothetical protein